jgi:hypothetical protein
MTSELNAANVLSEIEEQIIQVFDTTTNKSPTSCLSFLLEVSKDLPELVARTTTESLFFILWDNKQDIEVCSLWLKILLNLARSTRSHENLFKASPNGCITCFIYDIFIITSYHLSLIPLLSELLNIVFKDHRSKIIPALDLRTLCVCFRTESEAVIGTEMQGKNSNRAFF